MKPARVLAVTAALALFFLPALSPRAQFIYRDTGRMHAPVKRFVAGELAAGRLAEWNPHAGLGTPLVAGAIDAVLHPFNLLLAALPFEAAFKAWVLASFLAAALGGLAWGRALGLGGPAAALGGLIFALSGPLVSSSDNLTYLTSYAALPWYLAAVHRFVREGGPGPLTLVLVASFACAAGGDPQAWGLAVLAGLAYGVAVPGAGLPGRGARRSALAAGAALLGAAPAILPLLAWLGQSQRAAGTDAAELARWNLHPLRLPELVLPGLYRTDPADPVSPVFQAFCGGPTEPLPWFLSVYLGAAAAALAALGVARRREARWLAAAAALFAWAALGPHAGLGQLAARLPLAQGLRFWEKLAVWPALLLGLAAACGLQALLERPVEEGRWLARRAGLAALALLLVAGAAAWPGLLPPRLGHGAAGVRLAENLAGGAAQAAAVLLVLALVAHGLGRGRLAGAAALAVSAVVLADLFGGNAGAYVLGAVPDRTPPPLAAGASAAGEPARRVITAFTLREDRWPELGRLESTWRWGQRTLEPAWNVAAGVGNFRAYVGLRERRLDAVGRELARTGRWERCGLWGIGAAVVPGRLELAGRLQVPAPPRVLATDPELPAWLVELPHRPRVYLADEVAGVDEGGALAFALSGGTPGRTVVEGPRPAPAEAAPAPQEGTGADGARLVLERPGLVEVAARAGRAALLVVNDANVPGWTATVDGEPAPVVAANYLSRGVWLAPGEHRVRFEYRTPGLRAGLALAGAAAAALLAWAARRRRP